VKILIIKLSAIGDVVQSLCVLHALKTSFPDAEVDWLAGEAAAGLLEGHPMLEKVIIYPRKRFGDLCSQPLSWPQLMHEARIFISGLRKKRYDMVLDLQGLLKSGVLAWLSRGDRKIGFAATREGSSLFLNEKLDPYNPNEHAVLRYMRVAYHLGADDSRPICFPLGTGSNDFSKAAQLLERHGLEPGRTVGFIPGTRWETKHWTAAGFAETGELIRKETGLEPVILGSGADRRLSDEINSHTHRRITDLTGRTDLKTLAALFTMIAAVISTDTGPMHLAAAAGARIVALFGPTAPKRTGPFSSKSRVVCRHLSCSPCFRRRCDHNRCMREITPHEVVMHLKELLN